MFFSLVTLYGSKKVSSSVVDFNLACHSDVNWWRQNSTLLGYLNRINPKSARQRSQNWLPPCGPLLIQNMRGNSIFFLQTPPFGGKVQNVAWILAWRSGNNAIENIHAILKSHYYSCTCNFYLCWSSWICSSMFPRPGLVREVVLIPLRPSVSTPALTQNSGLMPWSGPIRTYLCSQTSMSRNVCVASQVNLHLMISLSLRLWTPSAAFETIGSVTGNSFVNGVSSFGL